MATGIRQIRRYVWLVNTIRNAGRITLEDINSKWLEEKSLRMADEGVIPMRTFHRHREAIADLFGIDIVCDRTGGNVYYIANEDELNEPTFTSRLFYGLAIDNQLASDDGITRRIMFEEAPGGKKFLPVIVEGLAKRREISLRYLGFGKWEEKDITIRPYGLKQSGRRWYLLAVNSGADNISVYALDRIEHCRLTDTIFDFDPSVDISSYFDEVVGINLDDEYDCEEVTFRIYGQQRAYIESLPLHKTQKCIRHEKEYSDYTVRVRPEYEFVHEILKQGFNAEVLSPAWLRDEIQWQAQEILKRYEGK